MNDALVHDGMVTISDTPAFAESIFNLRIGNSSGAFSFLGNMSYFIVSQSFGIRMGISNVIFLNFKASMMDGIGDTCMLDCEISLDKSVCFST